MSLHLAPLRFFLPFPVYPNPCFSFRDGPLPSTPVSLLSFHIHPPTYSFPPRIPQHEAPLSQRASASSFRYMLILIVVFFFLALFPTPTREELPRTVFPFLRHNLLFDFNSFFPLIFSLSRSFEPSSPPFSVPICLDSPQIFENFLRTES